MRSEYVMNRDVRVLELERALVRPCPRCGAVVGQPCVTKAGRRVTNVGDLHADRFRKSRVIRQ